MERALGDAVLGPGPAFDPAGAVASGAAAAGVLFGALRADADGADRLQSAVPMVCRIGDGCRDLAPDGVHAQPRTASGGGCRPCLPVGPAGVTAGARRSSQ